MSKSSGRIRQLMSQALSMAKQYRQLVGQVRVLHGPGKNAPSNLVRATFRQWHQLSASERSTYNEIDYRCERFDACHRDAAPAYSSIFTHCSREQAKAHPVEVKSVETAMPPEQVQKQQKN